MNRARNKQDGLPYRVYERRGERDYSIGFKSKSGVWAFRYSCPIGDLVQIAALRKKAIEESQKVNVDFLPVQTFSGLIDTWFDYQAKLPANLKIKRAQSTIDMNMDEAKNLKLAFGHLHPSEITKHMAYEYLDACLVAVDENGNARPRPEKGNKEIRLARLILEFGIRRNLLDANPFAGLTFNKTKKERRLVTPFEMELVVKTGRHYGGARLIVALALKTAFLCTRRPVEVRGITRDSITQSGILWIDGRDKTKPKILISWSPELKKTIDEVLKIKRNKVAGTMYLFGNMAGQKYTKGGWKSILDDLMFSCVEEAQKQSIPFKRFSLQDCRPMGVTTKLELGHTDVRDTTGHTSDKMIATVYDRRPVKNASPVQ